MTRTEREVQRSIDRIRRVLDIFGRLSSADRWYVLTRIAEEDDPPIFYQVVREQIRK